VKDRQRWQWFVIVIVLTSSSCFHSSQTWKRQLVSSFLCFFFFWPSSFLWKTKYDDDLWSLSSSPLPIFIPLKHKDNDFWYCLSVLCLLSLLLLWKKKDNDD
jgi:hypothetical protein